MFCWCIVWMNFTIIFLRSNLLGFWKYRAKRITCFRAWLGVFLNFNLHVFCSLCLSKSWFFDYGHFLFGLKCLLICLVNFLFLYSCRRIGLWSLWWVFNGRSLDSYLVELLLTLFNLWSKRFFKPIICHLQRLIHGKVMFIGNYFILVNRFKSWSKIARFRHRLARFPMSGIWSSFETVDLCSPSRIRTLKYPFVCTSFGRRSRFISAVLRLLQCFIHCEIPIRWNGIIALIAAKLIEIKWFSLSIIWSRIT